MQPSCSFPTRTRTHTHTLFLRLINSGLPSPPPKKTRVGAKPTSPIYSSSVHAAVASSTSTQSYPSYSYFTEAARTYSQNAPKPRLMAQVDRYFSSNGREAVATCYRCFSRRISIDRTTAAIFIWHAGPGKSCCSSDK